MGGEIGVESTVGRGSTFWVRLPQGRGASSPAAESESAPPPEDPGGKKYTLLYVEDNLVNLTLLQRFLDGHGEFNFLTAADGAQGLTMADDFPPDLILLDLYLPDMPGEQVLSKLRQDEKTAHIPVIIFSADATPGQADRLLAAGAQAYLTKPLEMGDLLQAIKRVLEKA
jgi:CheY-like chemotaxis protein